MNYQTKAQELSFLSRDYAVAKDKENWLALFTKDALVQDPIGKSPLDPEGNGHKGIAAIENFMMLLLLMEILNSRLLSPFPVQKNVQITPKLLTLLAI